jgi:hypothetical protein
MSRMIHVVSLAILVSTFAVGWIGGANNQAESDGMALGRKVIELERRLDALENQAVPVQVIPVYEGVGNPDEVRKRYEVEEIIPSNPALTLDLVCTISNTHLLYGGHYDTMKTLKCVRYQPIAPYGS